LPLCAKYPGSLIGEEPSKNSPLPQAGRGSKEEAVDKDDENKAKTASYLKDALAAVIKFWEGGKGGNPFFKKGFPF
jgi:hypothetical protein